MAENTAAGAALRARWANEEAYDTFEALLRDGRAPAIDDFLRDAPAAHRPELFRGLVKLELEYRFRRPFPEHAAVLDELLAPPSKPVSDHDALTTPHAGLVAAPGTAPAIPGYEMIRKLDAGGMGVVYLARQVAPNRLVAVK